MCGIAAIIDLDGPAGTAAEREARGAQLLAMLDKIRYRGDREHFGEIAVEDRFALGTNRLAIVDRDHARQPLRDGARRVQVVFNGEIYNHDALRRELQALGHRFETSSDTEVLLQGYLAWDTGLAARLDGIFAFVIVDEERQRFLAVRDHIGIKPLYYAHEDGRWLFASEQKCLLPYSARIHTVPPGTYVDEGRLRRYFDVTAVPPAPDPEADLAATVTRFHDYLDEAVRKQVQTDLPVVVMFSGGIDSTIVLHLARKYHPNVTALTVGFEGAADIDVARRFCRDYDIPHIVRHFGRDDLIDVMPSAVYQGEFFEAIDIVDTCVAYFGYREAHRNGFKLALCGEGSDEILAGYDLFRQHAQPAELMRYRVHNLHRTDLQRVDRASMMNSVEARVPFLDKDFLTFAYGLPLSLKLRDGVEKWILREAFRAELPPYIADRPKVRMPDGSGVKSTLMDYANQPVVLSGAVSATGFETTQAVFFLKHYLDAGFPLPAERHRRAGLDYNEGGYFTFVS